MKTIFNKLILIVASVLLIASCKTDDEKAILTDPSSVKVALSATTTTVVLDSTQAATTTAQTYSWNAADYGAKLSVTYNLQLDTTGSFTTPTVVNLGNLTTQAYTKKTLNDLALALGMKAGKIHHLYARIKSDVNTNVESVLSNVIDLTITPYSIKPTPKYPVPDNLYLVGDASPGGWSNPVATPSQQFTKIDDNTFAMIINLVGGKQYLLLPKNGDWSHKYSVSVASSAANPAGDVFEPDAANNIPAPAASGLYKIVVDFVKGTYAVTAVTTNPIPDNLYIVGDATQGGWANPVPVPSQQFTQTSNGEFQLTLALTSTKSYLLLPLNGDWGHKFGGADKLGGTLLADGNVPSSNTPAPDADGTYLIDVNFLSMTYTLTKQ